MPVLALSQLSRAVEQREDKRPQLSDLRESGSIEQDADMVWFVYREEYYVASREPKRPIEGDDAKVPRPTRSGSEEMERVYGLAELIIAKQRHGATGKVRLKFEAKITRFTDHVDDGYLPESGADARLRPAVQSSAADCWGRAGPTPIVARGALGLAAGHRIGAIIGGVIGARAVVAATGRCRRTARWTGRRWSACSS